MSDPKLVPTLDGADQAEGDGDLVLTDTLENAALLSLFGGNVDDDGTAGSRGQWWGNHVLASDAALRGATQHRLAKGPPVTSAERQYVERAALSDLAWMVPDYATRVDARAALSAPDELELLAAVEEAPGRVVLLRPVVPRDQVRWSSIAHPRLVTIAITSPSHGDELPVVEGLEVLVTTTGPASQVRVELGLELLETVALGNGRWLSTLALGVEHLGARRITATAENATPGLELVQSIVDVVVTNPTAATITSPIAGSTQWEEAQVPVSVTTTGLVDSVRVELEGAGDAELVEGPAGVWTGEVSPNGENAEAHLTVYLEPSAGVEYEADDVTFAIESATPAYPTIVAWGIGEAVGPAPDELIAGLTYSIFVAAPGGNLLADEVVVTPGWDGSGTLPEIEGVLVDDDPSVWLWECEFMVPAEWVGQTVTFQAVARNEYAENEGDSVDVPVVASAEWVTPANGATVRWGETLTVDVQTAGDVDHVDITIGSYTTEADSLGDGLYRATLTMTDAHYGAQAITATVTPSVGDPIELDGLSVTVKIDNPVASTGRTIPAAGAVTAWGDFAPLTGSSYSTGAAVKVGSTGAAAVLRSASKAIQPSQTVVALCSTAGTAWPNTAYLCRTTETAGAGLSLGYQAGYVLGQVHGTGGYVSQLYPTSTSTHDERLYSLSHDDTTDAAEVRVDGASTGANGSGTIVATRSAVTTNIDMQGDGTLFRFVGVWNRKLSAADLVQLKAELEAELTMAPIAQTGAAPAAGAVATWGSYAQASGTAQPTSDGAKVTFDGTNDRLTYTNATTGFSGRITAAVRWESATATWDDYPTFGVRGTCGWLIQGTTGTKEVKVLVANAAGTFIELHAHTFADITIPHTISFAWDHQAASGTVVIDGVLVDTHSQALSRDNTGSATHELGYDSTGPRYLNGSVHDARLYLGVAMTVAQQQALHVEMAA